MANTNTAPDFSVIWAEKSPIGLYNLTDEQIQEGWNFIKDIPPDRTMFDAWMNRADKKMKWMFDNMFSDDALAGYLFWRFKNSPYFVGEKVSLQKEYPTVYLECTVAGTTADEDMLNLPEGKKAGDVFTDGTVQWIVRQNASTSYVTESIGNHNTSEEAHANLIRVKSMSTTDDGINYVTQDNQSHSLGLWSTLKAVLTGTTAGSGNKNTLFQQLDAIAGMVKKITGGANWYDNPAASIQQLVSMVNSVSAISECDVDNPNAWWVKLRGEPGLIIQGRNLSNITFNTEYEFNWPVAFPHNCFGGVCNGNGHPTGAHPTYLLNLKITGASIWDQMGGATFFVLAIGY